MMSPFHSLLASFLEAHSSTYVLPDEFLKDFSYERKDNGDWLLSAVIHRERFTVTVDCEDLLGWLWATQRQLINELPRA